MSKPATEACDVITEPSQLAGCAGKRVTLRGEVTRTKQPTIHGVDVDADYELSDQIGEATGTLEQYTIEPPEPDGLQRASRGPGTYWRLVGETGLAKARRAP